MRLTILTLCASGLMTHAAAEETTYNFCARKLQEDSSHAFCLGYHRGVSDAWRYFTAQQGQQRRAGTAFSTKPPAPMTSRDHDSNAATEFLK
ncbi:MAG: hypothetical protein AAFR17_16885 [Pseudomonadota bacterium]